MTATGRDRITVTADTITDAEDVARRRWEIEGIRMVKVLRVFLGRLPGSWIVEADVEYGL